MGNLPGNPFDFVLLASNNKTVSKFELLDSRNNKIQELSFKQSDVVNSFNSYRVSVPSLNLGNYFLRLNQAELAPLNIQKYDLSFVLKSALSFIKRQRCGTATEDHAKSCHQKEVVETKDFKNSMRLIGGWHDAGDYIRYVLTSSYATVLLLNAAQELTSHEKIKTEILSEVEWGLNWLDKMWPTKNNFYYQIGDISDHSGWRLPETDDDSERVQKIYLSDTDKGANLAGRIVASMALYANLLKKYPNRRNESVYWEKRAIEIFEWSQSRLASQSSTNDFYIEDVWKDDMALAALELYHLTNKKTYLDRAESFFHNLENPYTFDFANIHILMYYKLGLYSEQYKPLALAELKRMLEDFENKSKKNAYGVALDKFYWGCHMHIKGTAMAGFFYDKLAKEDVFSFLGLHQWDYLMGKNQWGLNFVSGLGSQSINNPHHQIAQIKKVPLVGYWSPGPVTQKIWNDSKINLKGEDVLAAFQSNEAVIHNDSADYITNEPALTSSATGILLTAVMQNFVDGNF